MVEDGKPRGRFSFKFYGMHERGGALIFLSGCVHVALIYRGGGLDILIYQ